MLPIHTVTTVFVLCRRILHLVTESGGSRRSCSCTLCFRKKSNWAGSTRFSKQMCTFTWHASIWVHKLSRVEPAILGFGSALSAETNPLRIRDENVRASCSDWLGVCKPHWSRLIYIPVLSRRIATCFLRPSSRQMSLTSLVHCLLKGRCKWPLFICTYFVSIQVPLQPTLVSNLFTHLTWHVIGLKLHSSYHLPLQIWLQDSAEFDGHIFIELNLIWRLFQI